MRNLIIISAPSGSGKTTICKEIQKKDPQIKFSISHTSRSMRSNEEDGVDYFFIDHLKFQNFISNDYFIEWEKIHGDYYYGTSKNQIEDAINNNIFLLLELDVKGAVSIQKKYPENTLSFFVEPPSINDLKSRLKNRGSESIEKINKRLERIESEFSYKSFFDFIIVNDKVKKATNKILNIIYKETKGVFNVS